MHLLFKTVSLSFLLSSFYLATAMEKDHEPWLEQTAAGKGYSREDYVAIRATLPSEVYTQWKEQEAKDEVGYVNLQNTRRRLSEVVLDSVSYRKVFETLRVKDLKYIDIYANEERPIIRRSWDDYVKEHPFCRIVLFSGHKGHHGGIWGATQGNENYMIDTGEANEADAMLDVTNAEHIAYIPSNSVNEVVSDWQYFRECGIYERVLKKGGQLIFPAIYLQLDDQKANQGKPYVIFEDGRKARLSLEYYRKINGDEAARKELEAEMIKIAVPYHQTLGFRSIELVEWQGEGYIKPVHLWILTK
ncbi:MAG: hypothetical protein K2Y18_08545 [Alphaproteobacteria bacterium]|jgi:hypothetical protein|nr:hypothetical protein [Alphaproteobacteria bacterium]